MYCRVSRESISSWKEQVPVLAQLSCRRKGDIPTSRSQQSACSWQRLHDISQPGPQLPELHAKACIHDELAYIDIISWPDMKKLA